jgi:hypothetical protein
VTTLAELEAGTSVSLSVDMNDGCITIESSTDLAFLELVRIGGTS